MTTAVRSTFQDVSGPAAEFVTSWHKTLEKNDMSTMCCLLESGDEEAQTDIGVDQGVCSM